MRYGVYIGRDAEIVVTAHYAITYRRSQLGNFLESRLYRAESGRMICIGICRTTPVQTEQRVPPERWQWAHAFQKKEEATDATVQACIGDLLTIAYNGDSAIFTFGDGVSYQTQVDESFAMADLSPLLPAIDDQNIAECLRLWNMGVKEEYMDVDDERVFIGLTINTRKHMYIFELMSESIYCRAARYVTTNCGVVFCQNFRQGFEAYMIIDNREASEPLEVVQDLFSPDKCIWQGRSVYWSVDSYNENEIRLHGCQGETYRWRKPVRDT